ncbi:MAG: hypothetical protein KDB80_14120, partial [Planctomycetes bacterium]|nr:hypothetical protein [Planctomycetota bacterium]
MPPANAADRKPPATRRWFALVALTIATLVALGIAELALRVLDIPATPKQFEFLDPDNTVSELFGANAGIFTYDPDLLWKLDPNTELYAANELGLRGWLPRRPKAPTDVRIAFLGDSCTFGYNVAYEETYAPLVEQRLQAAHEDRCIESILAAMVGHSSQQHLVLYQDQIARYEPDITVVYAAAWNDYLASVGMTDAERYAERHAWRLQRMLYRAIGLDRATEASTPEMQSRLKAGEAPFGRRVSKQELRANLEGIQTVADRIGSQVVCILPPLPEKTMDERKYALDYRAVLVEYAQAHGLPVVDGTGVFDSYRRARLDAGETPAPLFLDWVHPSVLGHRLLADAVFDALAPLIPDRPNPETPSIRLDSFEPHEVAALSGAAIEIHGSGFDRPQAFDRVWIGGGWVHDAHVVDATRIRGTVPLLPVGQHDVRIITRAGVVHAGASLAVTPPPAQHPITAEVRTVDG